VRAPITKNQTKRLVNLGDHAVHAFAGGELSASTHQSQKGRNLVGERVVRPARHQYGDGVVIIPLKGDGKQTRPLMGLIRDVTSCESISDDGIMGCVERRDGT